MMKKATVKSHSNIALVKYWGKRNEKLNLPAVGSISITLKEIFTLTSVEFKKELKEDILILNNSEAPENQRKRVSRFLDLIRKEVGFDLSARIDSKNNFPTGAGLASSASAFASLALAGTVAAGIEKNETQLSQLARLGSGSAARSIFGGFVEMNKGNRADGSDSVAHQIAPEDYWDIRVLIAITSTEAKKTGSTEGMQHSAETSPYNSQWIKESVKDLTEMRQVIKSRDFKALGEISEYSCLKMHALAMSSRPALIYWNSTTMECIRLVYDLRKSGIPAYFTIDAGPQVKIICLPDYLNQIKKTLSKIGGVKKIISTSLGPGTALVGEM
jgi:diphosphomevalonate decarboxylase